MLFAFRNVGFVIFVQPVLPEVIPGLLDQHAGKGNQGNEVGQGHQAVGTIRKDPDQVYF